ncbi:cytochrome b [Pseudoduganella violaceinigra]|uniref:cytochrome b n=1 Tax=Pseudoduganella violaceinigra TaxID=246602 RepID=UPI000414C820|nr:cytochrome b [Pseudoduganella violaceinigra]
MDTTTKLSRTTIALHWLIALTMLGLCALGIYMVQTESWGLFHWHKSIGLILFGFILARVAWRLKQGLPPPVRDAARWEHLASKTAHWLLLAATVALPVTGMIYSGMGGHGFGVFGLEMVGSHYEAGKAVALDAGLSELGQAMHSWIGYGLLALAALHVGAALKHHFVDKDNTLRRMLGRS